MINIINIANIIDKNGGRLYLVGGAVRDKLTNVTPHDEDYCITGISSKKFKELFPQAFKRGKAFEVFEIEGKEFALARTEKKIGIGYNNRRRFRKKRYNNKFNCSRCNFRRDNRSIWW